MSEAHHHESLAPQVINEINARVAALRDIYVQLGKQGSSGTDGGAGPQSRAGPLVELSMQPDEVPEERERVTDADIDEYAVRKEEAERKAAGAGALGGFATGGGAAKTAQKPGAVGAAGSKAHGPMGAAGGGAKAGNNAGAEHGHVGGPGEDALSRMMAAVPLSDLERQLQAYYKRKVRACADVVVDLAG